MLLVAVLLPPSLLSAIGDVEGEVKILNEEVDTEASKWFADEWGNPTAGSNVTFALGSPAGTPKKPRKRLAILQSGVYNTWFWKPTLDMVVRPAVDAGWEVDYFGYFQRGPSKRYTGSEGRKKVGIRRTKSWNETVADFVHDIKKAGGHLRSLRTSMASAKAFIGKRFATEKEKPANMPTKKHCEDSPCAKGCEELCAVEKGEQCNPPHTGQQATEAQGWWNVLQTQRAFETYVLTHDVDPYTFVLRVREDAGWYAPIDLDLAKPGVTYVRPCMMYGGVSDKGYLTSPEHSMLIAQDMHAGRYTQLNHQYQENSEQLLWEVVNYNNIPYAPITQSNDRPVNSKYYMEAGPVRLHPWLDKSEGKAEFDEAGKMIKFGLTLSDARTYNEKGDWCFADRYFSYEDPAPADKGGCEEENIKFIPPGGKRLCSQVAMSDTPELPTPNE